MEKGVPPGQILYATFDHPLLKLAGLEGLLEIWTELEPDRRGPEYLFLDEIQYTKNWQTWLKQQVDFARNRRIAVTGSATPLVTDGQESGVGRWQTLRLATLSFYEYLQIRRVEMPDLTAVSSFSALFEWEPIRFAQEATRSTSLTAHFHEYLLRGGFPQTAQVESIAQAQKLLREDIVDKVLKRDMTALFGVRRVLELEQTFLYLCLHDGGVLDVSDLCKNLEVKKPTANNFIALLEAAHLIHKLAPFGYGKEILRARYKIYLSDAAIAPSVMLKGRSLLEDSTALGIAVETAFLKHLLIPANHRNIGLSYWKGSENREVDMVATVEGRQAPFEVKYRSPRATGLGELKGLQEFCVQKKVDRGYVITRERADFSILPFGDPRAGRKILKIPAPLACYWLGRSEVDSLPGLFDESIF